MVVTAPAFGDVVEPLCRHREADGYRVVRVRLDEPGTEAAAVRDRVRAALGGARSDAAVLLVGAVLPPGGKEDGARFVVPAFRGTIGRMEGRLSDNAYGCPDEGRMPDVAVGRLPARNADEARAMVEKILAFERDDRPKPWRHAITLLVGHPGGSSALERKFASTFVRNQISKPFADLDPRWRTRAVVHMPESLYTVPDDLVHEVSLDAVRDGQLFTVYLGHSSAGRLASTHADLMTREDWATLESTSGPGILLSCGCHTCQLEGWNGQGYGLAALRNPRGPVAVIGAEDVSAGAMGKLAFEGLLPLLEREEPPLRLAGWWLAMKRGIAEGPIGGLTFWLYDHADGTSGRVPLEVQRLEHLEMWMLLGDPALRLPLEPSGLDLGVKGTVAPGAAVVVEGTLPDALRDATVHVTLERPFGVAPEDLPVVPEGPPAARHDALLARWKRMNDVVIRRFDVQAAEGRFSVPMALPDRLPGDRWILRARAVSEARNADAAIALTPTAPR